jgi:hypothetical protein
MKIMRFAVFAAALAFVTPASAQYDEASMKNSVVVRIARAHRVTIDPSKFSLTQLLDIESRMGTSARIQRSFGVKLDYRSFPLITLLDLEGRLGAADRLGRMGVKVDYRVYSLASLLDIEARAQTAARIAKNHGVSVNWNQQSLASLMATETGLSRRLTSDSGIVPSRPSQAPTKPAPTAPTSEDYRSVARLQALTAYKVRLEQLQRQREALAAANAALGNQLTSQSSAYLRTPVPTLSNESQGGIFGRLNPANPFSEYSSPFGRYNPDNPFSEVSSPFGSLNPHNPLSEVASPFGKYNPDNPFSEVSSPFGSLNPDNPFSEVASPFGRFNPENPFSEGIHPATLHPQDR